MGVLRALALLTFIFWRLAKLMAAMVAGVSSLHSLKLHQHRQPPLATSPRPRPAVRVRDGAVVLTKEGRRGRRATHVGVAACQSVGSRRARLPSTHQLYHGNPGDGGGISALRRSSGSESPPSLLLCSMAGPT